VTWDAQTLDKWLTDPPAFIPGVNMQAQVNDPDSERTLLPISNPLAAMVEHRTISITDARSHCAPTFNRQ